MIKIAVLHIKTSEMYKMTIVEIAAVDFDSLSYGCNRTNAHKYRCYVYVCVCVQCYVSLLLLFSVLKNAVYCSRYRSRVKVVNSRSNLAFMMRNNSKDFINFGCVKVYKKQTANEDLLSACTLNKAFTVINFDLLLAFPFFVFGYFVFFILRMKLIHTI